MFCSVKVIGSIEEVALVSTRSFALHLAESKVLGQTILQLYALAHSLSGEAASFHLFESTPRSVRHPPTCDVSFEERAHLIIGCKSRSVAVELSDGLFQKCLGEVLLL